MSPWFEATLAHPATHLLLAVGLASIVQSLACGGPARRDAVAGWSLGLGLWACGAALLSGLPALPTPARDTSGHLPLLLQALALFLLADLLHYLMHRALHAVPLLWRVHQVHHADAAFDVATALRFHPLEALLSAAPLLALVAWLAPAPPAAALAFAGITLWNALQHMNPRPAATPGRLARWVLTPSMHRAHHAAAPPGGVGNFGLLFAGWDRLFGTWQAPLGGAAVGIPGWQPGDDLLGNLAAPLRRSP